MFNYLQELAAVLQTIVLQTKTLKPKNL